MKATSAALTFCGSIALARLLGVDRLGQYVFALAFAGVVALPAQLGLPTLVARNVAAYQACGALGSIHAHLRWARGRALRSTALVLLGGLAVGLAYGRDPLDATQASIALALLAVPCLIFARIDGAGVRGLQRPVVGLVPEVVAQPATLLVLVALLLGAGTWATAPVAMACHLASVLVAWLLAALLLRRWLPPAPLGVVAADQTRAWRGSMLSLGVLTGAQSLLLHTQSLMLGLLATEADVGLFRVASQVAAATTFGLQAIGPVVGPSVARRHALGDLRGVRRLARWSALGALALGLPVAVTALLLGDWILRRLFGPAFVAAYPALVIMLAGQVVNVSTGSISAVLNMCGHEGTTARTFLWSAGLNLLLNLILIPRYGVSGAALSAASTMMVWNAALLVVARRKLATPTVEAAAARRSG